MRITYVYQGHKFPQHTHAYKVYKMLMVHWHNLVKKTSTLNNRVINHAGKAVLNRCHVLVMLLESIRIICAPACLALFLKRSNLWHNVFVFLEVQVERMDRLLSRCVYVCAPTCICTYGKVQPWDITIIYIYITRHKVALAILCTSGVAPGCTSWCSLCPRKYYKTPTTCTHEF